MKPRSNGTASAALWQHYHDTGDPETRAELLAQYMGLVQHTVAAIATRVGDAVEFDDLLGAGTLGLVRAFEGFDASRGTAFTTYATQRIRGAVLDELRAADWRPRSARELGRQVQRATTALSQKLGRVPTSTEVAEELQIDLPTFWEWSAHATSARAVPLNDVMGDGEHGTATLADRLPDPNAVVPGAEIEHREQQDVVREAIMTLPEQQRVVLALCYDEGLNLRQIAEVLHVTESRVSQIRTAAIRTLKARVAMELV